MAMGYGIQENGWCIMASKCATQFGISLVIIFIAPYLVSKKCIEIRDYLATVD